MPNPRTAAAWVSQCKHGNGPEMATLLCTDCADAYARQQVEAERDRLLDEFSAALREHGMTPQRQVYPFADALDLLVQKQVEAVLTKVEDGMHPLRREIAAAIRALPL